jgi:PAS domain-containing protein
MAPVGYFILSDNGLILESNITAASLLSVSRNSLLKQPFTSFVLKEDQDIFYRHRKIMFESGVPQSYRLRIRKKDNTIFEAHIKSVPAQNESGSQNCRLVMIESDVTPLAVIKSENQV